MFRKILTRSICSAVVFALFPCTPVSLADSTDPVIARLPESRFLLLDGVRQAEASEGTAISAKFELDGNNFSLRVYTAKLGLEIEALDNIFEELAGDPTLNVWQPTIEIFSDYDDLRRSIRQYVAMQAGRFSLQDLIIRVSLRIPGTIYSVTPMARDGRPIAEVLVADGTGSSTTVVFDLRSGVISN